jgi:branched-chain amino acid transport system ATP-binding protein
VSAGISLVPEGRRTFGSLSVADNLRVGGFVAPRQVAARRQRVYDLFPLLAQRSRLPAAQLSGGEAQMLAIGQSLMVEPRLILLDEPSIGLAPIVVRALLETMSTLADAGMGVLLVEQSVRLAVRFTDTLYVLDHGRLSEPTSGSDEDALRAAYFGEVTGDQGRG